MRKINESFVRRICVNKDLGRHGLLGHFLKNIYGNALEALFWRLPTGINDRRFMGKVTYLTKRIINVELTDTFMGIYICKG